MSIKIRQANGDDAAILRELRLEALLKHPESFGGDYESEVSYSAAHWAARLEHNSDDAGFVAVNGKDLVGMAGIRLNSGSRKMHHNAIIWGVYVKPDQRGSNIAEQLITACLDWAKQKRVLLVKLSVVTSNAAAIRVYARCGFRAYGVDPKVISYNDVLYDELLMVREV